MEPMVVFAIFCLIVCVRIMCRERNPTSRRAAAMLSTVGIIAYLVKKRNAENSSKQKRRFER